MKLFLYLASLMLVANSCGNTKSTLNTVEDTISNTPISTEKIIVETKKNTIYSLVEDTAGSLYPAFETGNATTLIFNYTEKGAAGTADGDYTETVHLMIPNDSNYLKLKDQNLQQLKMVFGKFCFCRGEAGYYKVTNGSVSIKNEKGLMTIKASFEIPETSNKISTIEQVVVL
ncbi:hypothetical protein [Patiriisocius sp. Uisw_017]|jgi:hypothetical protein|uniref:hypothetical protein n=1 Tax=Patiriisocius sp. Uisw_017 TaxID=3230968 RepID=UPI0039EA31AA